ncbi:highly acidic protein [Campylobacter helveticus]|nr:highly acidic protein [Campylobacter helveticus]
MSWNDEEENFEEFDDEEEFENPQRSYNYDEDDYEFDDEENDDFYEVD